MVASNAGGVCLSGTGGGGILRVIFFLGSAYGSSFLTANVTGITEAFIFVLDDAPSCVVRVVPIHIWAAPSGAVVHKRTVAQRDVQIVDAVAERNDLVPESVEIPKAVTKVVEVGA